MKPTEEQIKKFWEWCGWKRGVSAGYKTWIYPEGFDAGLEGAYRKYEFYSPDLTLDNLFKYAVPELLVVKAKFEVMHRLHDWLEQVIIYEEDPTKTLFWAIWEVIKNDRARA